MRTHRDVTWEAYQESTPAEKMRWLRDDGRLIHVLFAQQFERADLESRFDQIRMIAS